MQLKRQGDDQRERGRERAGDDRHAKCIFYGRPGPDDCQVYSPAVAG